MPQPHPSPLTSQLILPHLQTLSSLSGNCCLKLHTAIYTLRQSPYGNLHFTTLQLVLVPCGGGRTSHLVPCDFYLFQELKNKLAGNKYETKAALILAVNRHISSRSTSWFAEGIQILPQRWQKRKRTFFRPPLVLSLICVKHSLIWKTSRGN